MGLGRLFAQAPDARHQFRQYARALCVFIPRVQGAELDADAVVALGRAGRVGVLGDMGNGVAVALQVAQGVGIGARAFAQHVVRKRQP